MEVRVIRKRAEIIITIMLKSLVEKMGNCMTIGRLSAERWKLKRDQIEMMEMKNMMKD